MFFKKYNNSNYDRNLFHKVLWHITCGVRYCVLLEDHLEEDELNSLIAHAHRRVDQLQRQLAEQQTLEHIRLDRAMERQREEDNILTEEAVQRENERCQAQFVVEKKDLVSRKPKQSATNYGISCG